MAAVVLGFAALAGLAWIRPLPAVAGEPEVGKGCQIQCLPKDFASRQIPLIRLTRYETITCRGKTSVILITKRDLRFCARPEDKWVQHTMAQLDARNAPPPSKASIPVPETSGVFDKFSRDADPTPTLAVDHTHSTGSYRMSTEFPVRRTSVPEHSGVYTTPFATEASRASREPTAKTEEVGVGGTFQPESVTGGNKVSSPTDRLKRFGEDLPVGGEDQAPDSGTAHDLVTSPTSIGTQSTTYSIFDTQNPMSSSEQSAFHLSSSSLSRLITRSVEKGMVPSTTSAMFSTSPGVPTSVLSTDRSSTHSSIDENNTRSLTVKDRSDAMNDPSVAFGGTSGTPLSTEARRDVSSEPPVSQPTSRFHQENVNERIRALATTYTPEVTLALFPGVLAGYRTHIISLVCVGVLFVVFAVVGWVWLKKSTSATAWPKEMAQGLLYNSSNSPSDDYAMQIL